MNNLTVKKESILFDFLLNYYNKKKVKTLLKYKQVQVNKQIITQFDYLLKPGDVVNIPPEVKHWHGAAKDSWFCHLAIEVPAKDASNEWLEPVSDEDYLKLK